MEEQHSLAGSEVEVEPAGARPEPDDLGVAPADEQVDHRRFSSGGEPLSTLYRAEPEHIRRLTSEMRAGTSAGWAFLRSVLEELGLDRRRAVVLGFDSPELDPAGATVLYEGGRMFSFFASAHPAMDQGLPVMRPDASFEIAPGPALIELPLADEVPDPLVRAGLVLLDERRA